MTRARGRTSVVGTSTWSPERPIESRSLRLSGTSYPFTLKWTHIVAPANNNFGAAKVLTGSNVTFPQLDQESGRLATGQIGEPRHTWAWESPVHSLWYRWTAPSTTQVTIDSHVGFRERPTTDSCYKPSTLAVYSGSSLSALTQVAQDTPDDGSGCFMAHVSFAVQAGVTYNIAIDAPYNSTPVGGTLTAEPVSDDWTDDSAASYSGLWGVVNSTAFYGGSKHYTTTVGNYAKFTFTGTKVAYIATKNSCRRIPSPSTSTASRRRQSASTPQPPPSRRPSGRPHS